MFVTEIGLLALSLRRLEVELIFKIRSLENYLLFLALNVLCDSHLKAFFSSAVQLPKFRYQR